MSLPPSKVIGCDFSGTVTTPNSSSFHQGDRIAGVIHGCKDSHTGGFADFLIADPDMCFVVPPNIELKEACTLGVGWISAAQALEQRLFKDVTESGKEVGKEDAVSRCLLFFLLLDTAIHHMSPPLSLSQKCSTDICYHDRHSSSSTAPPPIQACM